MFFIKLKNISYYYYIKNISAVLIFRNDLIGSNTIFIFGEFCNPLKVKVTFSFGGGGKI